MALTILQLKNLNGQIAERLGSEIVSGAIPEGSRLPVEAELCERFGVSRPVIREVTKTLASKGLITARPRVGTAVRPRRYWNLLDPEVLGWLIRALPESRFLDMLFEVRMAIEPSAAALAAVNATEQDIAEIAAAYREMALARTPEELLKPDVRFHQCIMVATHNELMSYIGNTLHAALSASIRLTSRHPNTHELSLPRHEAVYKAIAKRDTGAARVAVENLLRESRKDFDAVAPAGGAD
ncbi:MAG TPA: FadR/GntR family transcriptional regulator [Gammaproteobacteria bacterium]|nr:FadR/GntR family transcriptional regulator [Gammaproteobacteria bacterium]